MSQTDSAAPSSNAASGWDLFSGHPSHRSQLGTHLGGGLCSTAGIAGTAYMVWLGVGGWSAVALAGVLAGVLLHLVAFMRVKRVLYRVSNRLVEVDQGLIRRRVVSHELARTSELRFHQGLMQRMLGIGDVELRTAADGTALFLKGVPRAHDLYDAMRNAMNQRAVAPPANR